MRLPWRRPVEDRMPEWRDGKRVVSITIARNEQDVIEPFVRHNLRVLDRMVVLDHGSVDDTRSILDRLAAETGRVSVAALPEFGFRQSAQMTALLHRVQATAKADFILPLDADEFVAVADRAAMLRAFETIAVGGAGLIPWRTYVVTGRRGELDDPPRSFRYRRVAEVPRYRKAVLRFDGAPAEDMVIEAGSHIVCSRSNGAIPLPDLSGVALIHVPIRSAAQLEGKAIVGFMTRYGGQTVTADSPLHMREIRELFDLAARGDDAFSPQALRSLSMSYAQDQTPSIVRDPASWSYVRRYSDGRPLASVALIARSWDASSAKSDGQENACGLGGPGPVSDRR